MVRKLFLTPPDTPGETACRSIEIPNSPQWLGIFNAAILMLTNPYNYEQVNEGDLSPDEVAAICYEKYVAYLLGCGVTPAEVAAPYWESTDASDADVEALPAAESWFGYLEGANFVDDLAGWVFVGAVAIAYGADAAIGFATGLKRLRLLLRTGDAGAIVRVLLDGVVSNEVDTYSPEPGLVAVDVYPTNTTVIIQNTGTANENASPVNGGYAMEVIKKRLWEGELGSTNVRLDPDTGIYQVRFNELTDWVDSPQSDPRTMTIFPQSATVNIPCNSAATVVYNIHLAIDQWILNIDQLGTVEALTAAILGAVGLFFPAMFLIAAAAALAALLIEAGGDVINDAFTDEVYRVLKCIFYLNMDANGAISSAALTAIEADIGDQTDAVVQVTMGVFTELLGYGGLTDAGRLNPQTDTCFDCDENWCFEWDFTQDPGEWTPYSIYGDYEAGVGWKSHYTGSAYSLLIGVPISPSNSLWKADFDYVLDGLGGSDVVAAFWYDGSFHAITSNHNTQSGEHLQQTLISPTTTIDIPNFYFNASGGGNHTFTLTRLRMYGQFGNNPFGEDNC